MGSDTGTEKKKIGRPKGSKNKNGYTTSSKAIMQRRKNANVLPFTDEEKEYNARHIDHILRIHEISTHADIKDPVSLRSCFISYLMLCQQDGFKVGNLAAYAAMGVNKQTVLNWERSDRAEYRDLAIFVRTACSLSRENLISDNKINPVIGIFWQRNFDGLRNDTEQQQIAEQMNDDNVNNASDYMKKYGKLIED